ncbi:hypothetical protein AB5J62_14430 [Amycolatopsis sp. cg5]|uniref:hypothetical protein n=1 Tax=Amycolatopsis sp. cg5 TaxID=3238802 RepID=UPI0035251027
MGRFARTGFGVAALGLSLLGSAAFANPATAAGAKLSHAEAAAKFAAAGITISSSGRCSDRENPECTSLDEINQTTVDGVLALRAGSGCSLVITGGTEVGHADLPYSHYLGYKVDIRLTSCVNGYIRRTFTPVVPPALGSEQYRSADGDLYSYEGNHWDIEYH